MRVPLVDLFVLFPGALLHSRVTGACPVTTGLMVRVNVRTTTTTAAAATSTTTTTTTTYRYTTTATTAITTAAAVKF